MKISLCLLFVATAHDSCCNSAILNSLKPADDAAGKFDELAVAKHMQKHYPEMAQEVPDPEGMPMPDDWDEEDDGPWATLMIANPTYATTKQAVLREYASKFQKAPTNIPPAVYKVLGPKIGGALATLLDRAKFEAFLANFLTSLKGACPWLLLGLLCTATMQTLMSLLPAFTELVDLRSNDGNSTGGVWLSLKGALLGLLTPLCSCGTLPMVISYISYI